MFVSDIKVKEQSVENFIRGKKIYEPARFMKVNEASSQLLSILKNRMSKCTDEENTEENTNTQLEKENSDENFTGLTEDSLCVAAVRVGTDSQTLVRATLKGCTNILLILLNTC